MPNEDQPDLLVKGIITNDLDYRIVLQMGEHTIEFTPQEGKKYGLNLVELASIGQVLEVYAKKMRQAGVPHEAIVGSIGTLIASLGAVPKIDDDLPPPIKNLAV